MKKTILTLAIVLGMGIGAFAQEGGGLFGLGMSSGYNDDATRGEGDSFLSLPSSHGGTDDENAPLGSGACLLIGFGAAYALKKRSEK